jgi:propanol-preferring alcohol dehydrogenase
VNCSTHTYGREKNCTVLDVPSTDTGDMKRDLCLSLGAEKWIDFKTTTDLVKDVKEATGGNGPHAAVVTAANVRHSPS